MWWRFKIFPKVEQEESRLRGGSLSNKTFQNVGIDTENNAIQKTNDEGFQCVPKPLKSDEDWSRLNMELKNSQAAALAASINSDRTLHKLQRKLELTRSLSEVESDARIKSERNKSNLMLEKHQSDFELAAAASAKRILELIVESEITEKRFEDELKSRIAIERFTSEMTSEIAIQFMDKKLADQQLKYESPVFGGNSEISLAGAMQPLQSELITRESQKEADTKVRAVQESYNAANAAKVELDTIVQKMKLEFESALAAASNASQLSIESLRFKTQLASHFLRKQCDSRLISEQAITEDAVKMAAKTNAVLLADQQFRYEIAADAERDAFQASMDILQEDSKTIIDACNVKLVAKELKYAVAKLTGEKLEQQILTDRLEHEAAAANKESELLLSICGNVAHDLKSPLLTLVLGIEGLRSVRSSCPQSAEVLDTLESACAFMNAAISRTITKASIGVGLSPCKTTFDLQISLSNPLKWIKTMLPQDGKITLELDPLPAEVYTMIISDQHWLEENLLCLLSNAVKYSSHGIVRTVVTLNGAMVRVTVEDDGIGIDDSSKPMLFQQFSQVQRMTVGGSGLGLYSMSKRSDAIGGSCGMDNRKNGIQGSSFWFEAPYFPDTLCPPSDVEGSAKEPSNLSNKRVSTNSPSSDLKAEPSNPLHILIVDDSIAVVKMLSNKLQNSGYTVESAKDGAEGLEKMKVMCDRLDLVIMDLQMPVMDGIEATARFRDWEKKHVLEPLSAQIRRLPIVCSSANCSGKTEVRAIAAGVDAFLPKPFNMAALTDALKHASPSTLHLNVSLPVSTLEMSMTQANPS